VALLMSTGLTFGTIGSQAGLSMGVITREQFSVLVCVVILSAVVPTAVAQTLLRRRRPGAFPAPAEESDVPSDDEVPGHRRPR
jgi:hypothetical protein